MKNTTSTPKAPKTVDRKKITIKTRVHNGYDGRGGSYE